MIIILRLCNFEPRINGIPVNYVAFVRFCRLAWHGSPFIVVRICQYKGIIIGSVNTRCACNLIRRIACILIIGRRCRFIPRILRQQAIGGLRTARKFEPSSVGFRCRKINDLLFDRPGDDDRARLVCLGALCPRIVCDAFGIIQRNCNCINIRLRSKKLIFGINELSFRPGELSLEICFIVIVQNNRLFHAVQTALLRILIFGRSFTQIRCVHRYGIDRPSERFFRGVGAVGPRIVCDAFGIIQRDRDRIDVCMGGINRSGSLVKTAAFVRAVVCRNCNGHGLCVVCGDRGRLLPSGITGLLLLRTVVKSRQFNDARNDIPTDIFRFKSAAFPCVVSRRGDGERISPRVHARIVLAESKIRCKALRIFNFYASELFRLNNDKNLFAVGIRITLHSADRARRIIYRGR